MRWRYGFEPLHYRCLRADDGMAIVRVRRRGPSVEAVVADVVAASRRTTGALLRRTAGLPGVDHVLSLATMPAPAPWRPPVPGLGPRLTTRDLARDAPPPGRLRLALGDVELF